MSKGKRYKGLKFNYRVKGQNKVFMDKYLTIEDFLGTQFPKNNNPLSPTYDTEIFNINWNSHEVSINECVKTVNDLKRLLSAPCYISDTDIRLTEHGNDFSWKLIERKSIHSIETVRNLTKNVLFEKDKRNAKVELDGDVIKGNSQRYQLFFTKGMKCVCCGIEGKYFAKEKHEKDKSYHLNLYGITDNGQEVLITKDHIIPKSKGGKDKLENYQTMCVICNKLKGNKI